MRSTGGGCQGLEYICEGLGWKGTFYGFIRTDPQSPPPPCKHNKQHVPFTECESLPPHSDLINNKYTGGGVSGPKGCERTRGSDPMLPQTRGKRSQEEGEEGRKGAGQKKKGPDKKKNARIV